MPDKQEQQQQTNLSPNNSISIQDVKGAEGSEEVRNIHFYRIY
jgi:hypothetical protein